MISKRQLYAMGETFGDSATRTKPGGRVYGGGGSGGQTTTNSVDPRFDQIINYATKAAGRVENAGFTPYTDQRYAGINSTQQAGLDAITQRALGGDPTMQQANQTLQQTLKGGNTNPYLDSMVNKAQQSVLANARGADIQSGSFGNSGVAEAATKNMGDIATNMYGNAYSGDRANQMQALGMAPQYGNQAYQDANQLMNAGNFVQGQDQQNKDFAFNQFTDQQNLPYKQMAAYTGLLGSSGTTSTQSSSGGGK